MAEPGFNYRLSDIQCALGTSQLTRLDRLVATRLELAAHYCARLAGLAPAIVPVSVRPEADPAWHLFVVLIDFAAIGMTRGALMRELSAQGIGTQVHYNPVYAQPYYRERYGEMRLPGAEAYYERCLSLPLFPGMTMDDVDRVVSALRAIVEGKR
jgi:dTDP-4-amino-4,6-dideoxygalactose transaminase